MEALEVLKNLVAKFNDLKEANENYRTWRDTSLANCFTEAKEFLAKQEPVAEVKIEQPEEKTEEPKEEPKPEA